MKCKYILIALLLSASVFGDEWIPFNTQTGKAKVSGTGTGNPSKPYDFTAVSVTGIGGGGGGGSPGGLTGDLQYKSGSSAFGGAPTINYNAGTDVVTLLTGNKINFADLTVTTRRFKMDLSGISNGVTRTFTIPDADFTGAVPFGSSIGSFVIGLSSTGVFTTSVVTDAMLSTSDITTNNVSTSKHGFAPKLPGDAGKFLNGTGAYTVPPSGGGGTPGGSTAQMQFNNAGAFGGVPGLTSDGVTAFIGGGAKSRLQDFSDPTKQISLNLSNIPSGTTKSLTFAGNDSVTVAPDTGATNNFLTGITGVGVITKAQPAFSNLSGSIGATQNNIPVGKTLYLDAVNGNNSTALTNRFDRPFASLNGVAGAIANAAAGDEIVLGPGTFTETGAVALPQNISFVGSGAGVTTIVTTGGVKPGTGDKIADMTIDARTGSNASASFALGAETTDTAFTDVTINGVELLGNTDGFYFNKAGIDRVSIYDSYVTTTNETVLMGNMTGSATFYNCVFNADGSIGGASIVSGVNSTKGTVNLYGGTFNLSNGVNEVRGIRAQSGSTVACHNVTFNGTATTKFDLHQSGTGVLSNDQSVRADGTALLTSGTITQIINSYEGNLGLTDITTANVTTGRHGFTPKLPNDATKYLDGTGAYTVPAGSGGGGGTLTQQDVGDADATITAGTNVVNLTTALTASRVLTLPLASAYAPKTPIIIVDPKRVVGATFDLSVARSGADTINGIIGNAVIMEAAGTGGAVTLITDGVSKWSFKNKGVNNTVYDITAWNSVGTIAPSMNVLRDYFVLFDSDGDGKVDTLDSVAGLPQTDASGLITSTRTAPAGAIVGTSDSQHESNKRIDPRVTSTTSAATWIPSADSDDIYQINAQAVAVTAINNPTGTPVAGQSLIIKFRDDGTPRALAWTGSQWEAQPGLSLPITTVASQYDYAAFKWNGITSKWTMLASSQSGTAVDNTAFGPSWNGVTAIASSKNAAYDFLHTIFPNDDNTVVNAATGFTIGGVATAGKILRGNSANFVASNATYPAVALAAGYSFRDDGINGFVDYPAQLINSSNSNQTGFASDTYLGGSAATVVAGDFKVSGIYHCVFDMVKTGAGTATPIINVRIGTSGTTADTSRMTFTFGAGTGVADTGTFEVWLVFRTVGAGTSAVVSGICKGQHNLATTGLFNNAANWTIVGTVSAGFNSSAATKIGVSFNGGTSFSGTNTLVQATLQQ